MNGLPSFFYINKQEYQILNKRSSKFGEEQYQVRGGTVPSFGRNSTKFWDIKYKVQTTSISISSEPFSGQTVF